MTKHDNKSLTLFIQYSKEVENVPAQFARELAETIIKEREKVAQLEMAIDLQHNGLSELLDCHLG